MEKITNMKLILMALVIAFIFGFFARLGGRTVDFLWPDQPVRVEYKIKAEQGPVG